MTHELPPLHWLNNTLLDDGFIRQKADELSAQPIPCDLERWLQQQFDAATLAQRNEAQLEEKFIAPLLAQLGWTKAYQVGITVQGKFAKPDYCLMLHPEQENALIASPEQRFITAICECKAWDKRLDTGKADPKDNPHHQLQGYLSTLRVRFGFLTNGRRWRVYDTDKITARKTYMEFDLETICALPAGPEKTQALALFAFFFGRNTYLPPADDAQHSPMVQAIAASADFTWAVEENLKAVIYGYAGEDSVFEIMGRAIVQTSPDASLDEVYENSVVLLFRLLFVVYFEDKNAPLLQAHPFYQRYSLAQLYQWLRSQSADRDALHDGVYTLKQLFARLDQGAEDIDIPLFNGGLFDPQRAPLLLKPKMFNNATLRQLLEKLLFKTQRGQTLFNARRDFKSMSVTHLGRIYEGLLEFRFERARESAVYLEFESAATKGKVVEAYFDTYDAALIRREKGFRALREIPVQKGEVFLKSASNSRKTTASYYTEPTLSQPLVKAAIDRALHNAQARSQGAASTATPASHADGRAFMTLKILDNACGSGHFLVEALAYLTDLALARLDTDPVLQQLVGEERSKMAQALRPLNLSFEPEDAQILKRALLKRCIFGVDLNPFAVELARLSLWMDSFIFGTPLSFIEHHVQHGNSLMGASVQDFMAFNATEARQHDMFVQNLGARFDELRTVMHTLDAMRDTTAQEVEQSKALWKQQIAPKLRLLSRALSFICTGRAMLAEGKPQDWEALKKTPDILSQLFDERPDTSPALKQVEDYARRYRFFHFEVAFPEAFASTTSTTTLANGAADSHNGFDAVVGNPPWDKTKFSDADFFPQYHSNYRSLKNADKAAVQARLLSSPHIAQAYEASKREMDVANQYYKAAYPLNRGTGDGNLFRFFVERNLGLLTEGGNLCYVLPSALMFEEGSTLLRQHIFNHCQMPFFWSFENRSGLFPDVDSRYKFAQMQIVKTPPEPAAQPPGAVIDTAFYLLSTTELRDPARHIAYPLATVKMLSPEHWSLMELRDQADLPILQKCYQAFAPLSPDWLDFRNELHMTADKALFLEKPAPGLLPLYEGKMIWQYTHRLSPPQYWLDPVAFDERMHSKELYRMAQDLGVPRADVAQHADAVHYDREYVRLGFREIASDTNERSVIFALLPKNIGYGHTLFVNSAKTYLLHENGQLETRAVSPLRLLFALAWFNSLPVDWLARFMIQIHISKTYLYRLPMPQPTDEDIRSNPVYSQLAKNALLLTLAAPSPTGSRPAWDDFAELAPLFQVQRSHLPTTAKAFDRLRAQNDQLVAQAYGISPPELAHMLSSFKVMASKRPEYVALLLNPPD
ncbi:MAG: hypothetical protein RLZZ352_1086 [Pseudomonadota bacterium]|jgi:hypothetical protein